MTDSEPTHLAHALRLIVITDRRAAAPRDVVDVVAAAIEGGARAIQVRDKHATARELFDRASALRSVTRASGALLFVNDRVDVALAVGADGAHVGPDDLPLSDLRRWLPPSFLLGYSTDDPDEARRAQAAGANYIGCGAVFPTRSKDVGDEAIGVTGLERVARAVTVPVVGIGGITADNVAHIAASSATGVAVLSAVMAAEDPRAVVEAILAQVPAQST